MNIWSCLITGDDHSMLVEETPESRKKVVAMSIAILVPTLLWTVNGFLLAHNVLGAGVFIALITALVCGLLIFTLERLIIMSDGGGWLTAFRFLIGFLVALLGAVALDEVIFKKDIDIKMATYKTDFKMNARKKAGEEFDRSQNMQDLRGNVETARLELAHAEQVLNREVDGKAVSGKVGFGSNAQYKKSVKEEKERNYLIAFASLQQKQKERLDAMDQAESEAESGFGESALLLRIKALWELVKTDHFMMGIYIVFSLLLFFLEFLVIILKKTWKKTHYEKRVEMMERIGQRRLELMAHPNSILLDPGYFTPGLQEGFKGRSGIFG